METEMICSVCGAVLTEETTHEFEEQIMCENCFSSETTLCECCGVRIWRGDSYGNNSIILCEDCHDNRYTTCDECGELVYNSDVYYDDSDNALCPSCHTKMLDKSIQSYYYKPEPNFYGSGKLFMGVELEIDKGGEDDDNADALLQIANAENERLYAKHDGSIDNGFELVSHPMTLDFHTNEMKWAEIFHKAIQMEYRSHQTSTCGLHIHINRSAFGETLDMQETVIARIVYFVENHWNELLRFSRRTEENINRWASRYGISENTQDTYKKAKDKRLGRYVAVNLENADTVEFRLFRGTLRYATFIATLQLVNEICDTCIYLNDKELEHLSWSDFVSNIRESSQLIDYLKSKRLYVNEITDELEEV